MRRLAAVSLVAAFVLALPAAGSAKTIRLGWSESAVVQGKTIMKFKVGALVIEDGAWAVAVSFTNTSKVTLAVKKQFSLLLFKTKTEQKDYSVLRASVFDPRMPSKLAPGQTWTGAFGGAGEPPRGRFVRVAFGYFVGKVVPGWPGFNWVTDHAHRA